MNTGWYVIALITEKETLLEMGDVIRFLAGPFTTYDEAGQRGYAVVDYVKRKAPREARYMQFNVMQVTTPVLPKAALNKILKLDAPAERWKSLV